MLRLSFVRKARFENLQVRVRSCTTLVEKSKESLEAISKRKAFRTIDLDMKIMDRLDTMNVGFLPKRKSRVAVAQKFDPQSSRFKEPERFEDDKRVPFPFRGIGKVINQAKTRSELPNIKGSPPEIALIGRSNVGKSTLVNALLGFDSSYTQKALVSDKPGETKNLTFYQMGMNYKPPSKLATADPNFAGEPEKLFKTPALVLTDMPGYGFAYMSEKEKMRCHMLCLDYLVSNITRNRVIKRVVLLLDGRHGLKASDLMFLQDLQRHLIETVAALGGPDSKELQHILPTPAVAPSADGDSNNNEDAPPPIVLSGKATKLLSRHLGWKLQLVLTKCDLVDRPELCRRITEVSRTVSDRLPALFHSMLPTLALSAMEKKGVQEMQRDVAALVPPRWEEDPNLKKQRGEASTLPADKNSMHNHNRSKFTIEKPGSDKSKGKFGIFEKSHEAKVSPDRLSFAERRKQRMEEKAQQGPGGEVSAERERGPTRLSFADRAAQRRGMGNNLLPDRDARKDQPDKTRSAHKAQKAGTAVTSATESSNGGSKTSPGKRASREAFDEYAEAIDDYFEDEDLDDGDLLDSDFEDGDVEGDLNDFSDEEDYGVNWRAAGEDFGDLSDEEDEILREAQLAGELGGYRNTGPSKETLQLVKERRRLQAKQAKDAQSAKGALVKPQRTVPFSKKGNFQGGVERTKINGFWRVPKTETNPKGRHRYANPADKNGPPGSKPKSSSYEGKSRGSHGSKESSPKGQNGTFKPKTGTGGAGKRSPPKRAAPQESGRNRYY